jgi:hypothetical protein
MTTATTITVVREDDTIQHVEDDTIVTIIRNNAFVAVHWNDLTQAERREIYVNQFSIYKY